MRNKVLRDFPLVQNLGEETRQALTEVDLQVEGYAARLREAVSDLPRLLDERLEVERVRRWVADDVGDIRSAMFSDSVWGQIRWRRALGVPETDLMSDAFAFAFEYLAVRGVATPAGQVAEPDWEEGINPLLWDGPHDDEYYRVSYILFARGGFFNRLLVGLRAEVGWAPPFPRWSSNRRVLIWPDTLLNWAGIFFHHKDTVIVNGDYEVIKRF